MRFRLWTIVCLLMIISACNQDIKICEEPTDVKLTIGFYHKIDSTQYQDTSLSLAYVQTLHQPPVLLIDTSTFQSISLPLNQLADSSGFIIQPDSVNLADTILIYYARQQKLLSPGCGFVTFFTIDTIHYTTHHIDSASVVNKSVINIHEEHIRLFY
ncbi:DUF6452 family protein [Thermoflavifilum thermophilum]|uniref:Uncharacterized protein n=1 Tax=Thermoflavifilum thermophilum TaxID=1393122 RepID=A0A1I7N753_9BACT|nr:DUF6452 family protein [Thermoflavifilum thermophilum]SFV30500.1 hypothetical protein SAMN05660895_0811 [Thermoflavifilum thermophilum]